MKPKRDLQRELRYAQRLVALVVNNKNKRDNTKLRIEQYYKETSLSYLYLYVTADWRRRFYAYTLRFRGDDYDDIFRNLHKNFFKYLPEGLV